MTMTPNPTEGKVVDSSTPNTDAGQGSSAASGAETSKRRRVSTAREAQNLMSNSYWLVPKAVGE